MKKKSEKDGIMFYITVIILAWIFGSFVLNVSTSVGTEECDGLRIVSKIFFVVPCLYFNEYNEETDVCEEWEWDCKNVKDYNEMYNKKDCDEKNRCLKWREKNICEINPKAEGCICDEYETITISHDYQRCIDRYYNYSDFLDRTFQCDDGLSFTYDRKGNSLTIDGKRNEEFLRFIGEDMELLYITCTGSCVREIIETTCIKAHEPVCKEKWVSKWYVQKQSTTLNALERWHGDYSRKYDNINVTKVTSSFDCLKECNLPGCIAEIGTCTENVSLDSVSVKYGGSVLENLLDRKVQVEFTYSVDFGWYEEVCE